MSGKERNLRGKGEFDYDYVNDILFFKVKDRNYEKSIEFDNFVLDVDDENFVVGIQIYDASEYFRISKNYLRVAVKWELQAKVTPLTASESKIEIRLMFQIKVRNRILQPEPIITQNVNDSLQESKMICVPAK